MFHQIVGHIVPVPSPGQHQGGLAIDIDCIDVGPSLDQHFNDWEGHPTLNRKVKDCGEVIKGASDPDSIIQQPLQFIRINP